MRDISIIQLNQKYASNRHIHTLITTTQRTTDNNTATALLQGLGYIVQGNMSIFRNFRNGLVSLSMVRRCAILEMKSGENRFNPEFIEQLNNALDEVEKSDEVDALVTVGSGKFFSNGLDIPFVMDSDKDKVSVFMKDYSKLMARFLTFPMPTAAAINGKERQNILG